MSRISVGLLALVLLLAAMLPSTYAAPSRPTLDFMVNTIADASDVNPGNGLCASASGSCTLRAAVEEADALAGADSVLVPAGLYTLTLGQVFVTSADPLTIRAATSDAVVVELGGRSRFVHVGASGNLTLRGLTLRGGTDHNGGGAIYNQGTLVVEHSSLTSNSATTGSGTTSKKGGAIYNAGTLTVLQSSVSGNQAESGGAIDNAISGTATVQQSSISGNMAMAWGGGIANWGLLTVAESTIDRNQSGYAYGSPYGSPYGGGVFNVGTLNVLQSTISHNTAEFGGGIFNYTYSSATIQQSTISGNTVDMWGGGLFNSADAFLNVDYSTISGNLAASGGGLFAEAAISPYAMILAGNQAINSPDCHSAQNSIYSQGYNLIGNDSGCLFVQDTGDRLNVDARLDKLADNGGLTLTHAPLFGSPAVDAIPAGACSSSVDQRGGPRPVDNDGDGTPECNIGAVELVQATVYLPLVLR